MKVWFRYVDEKAETVLMEMQNLFKYKDKVTDKFKQSLVIYRINCAECSSFYTGKTERIMGYRYKGHIYNTQIWS